MDRNLFLSNITEEPSEYAKGLMQTVKEMQCHNFTELFQC